MNKVLYIAETNLQIINCLNINRTWKESADMAILLHDGIDISIVDRIRNENIFDKVFCIEHPNKQKGIYGILNKLKLSIIDDLVSRDIEISTYTDIFVYSLSLIKVLSRNNKRIFRQGKEQSSIKYHLFDEGIGAYFSKYLYKKLKYIEVYKIWLYEPILAEYYDQYTDILVKIPKISINNEEFIAQLKRIFNFNKIEILDNSLIFFDQPDEYLNNHIVENFISNLDKRITKYIKMHPRSDISRRRFYEKLNVTILPADKIPWEIVVLDNKFSNVINSTLYSTAAVTGMLMIDEYKEKFCVILYKLCGYNFCENESNKIVRNNLDMFFINMAKLNYNIKTPDSMGEAINLINR